MEKTWRWFGKKDKITLGMLRQIGVEGIVTALLDVPNGEIWTEEAINDLKTYIECLFIGRYKCFLKHTSCSVFKLNGNRN